MDVGMGGRAAEEIFLGKERVTGAKSKHIIFNNAKTLVNICLLFLF